MLFLVEPLFAMPANVGEENCQYLQPPSSAAGFYQQKRDARHRISAKKVHYMTWIRIAVSIESLWTILSSPLIGQLHMDGGGHQSIDALTTTRHNPWIKTKIGKLQSPPQPLFQALETLVSYRSFHYQGKLRRTQWSSMTISSYTRRRTPPYASISWLRYPSKAPPSWTPS